MQESVKRADVKYGLGVMPSENVC